MPRAPRPDWLPAPTLTPWRLARRMSKGDFGVFEVAHAEAYDGRGALRGDAYTLCCPDWCNVVALTDAEQLILVYQYRFGTEAHSLEVPGGVVDPGEAPIDAAQRELLEETGFAAASIEPLGVSHPNPALQGNACHNFVARGCRRVADLAPDPLEELEVVLVDAARVHDLIDGGHVTHALAVLGLERYARSRGR